MKAESGKRKAEGNTTPSRDATHRRIAANLNATNLNSGMTLVELLLVLVLIVVLSSLAAPLFEGSLASVRLRGGSDQMLAAWSQARTHAIESGKAYQFRFEPEGSNYRVDPWLGGIDPETLEDDTTLNTLGRTEAEIELEDWKLEASLPEAILFSSAKSVLADENGEPSVTRLDQETTTAKWSAAILFYPDGTTSTASLLLENGRGLFRRATLRALTGVGRVSDVLSREEVGRLESR